ncbi:hypothetical protein [Litorivivens sp.]|uniref:hypothetical protein n=1 Tax=Litorivivens sp. TaxID=2020868 RepID=UPI0035638377
MKPSVNAAPLRALLIGVNSTRSEKLLPLLENLGIDLLPKEHARPDLYQLLQVQQPDLIFVDVNSPARDTLEHVVSSDPNLPQPVVNADGDLRISLRRLAGDIDISLYVRNTVSPALLQALIDITISHCHSFDVVRHEIALLQAHENTELIREAIH